ncbi:MAG: hypothetical protein EB127_14380 [Alphaproteobacteria bacterium]|nr:hypothetical protein [Alphaproteobacteria bacterium]
MNELSKVIKEQEGYRIFESLIPNILISDLLQCVPALKKVRAVSNDRMYREREKIQELTDIVIHWSETVEKLPEFIKIKNIIDHFPHLLFYAADIVTINPKSNYFNPHVDTPHRFDKWNFDTRLLGIQCIITLEDTNKQNAATGLVPYSQKRDFDIGKCYNGDYNRWFLSNAVQHDMPKGSLLLYNCRVLHSSMPNGTDKSRPALLINYLDRSIIEEVSKIDNVWTSNA